MYIPKKHFVKHMHMHNNILLLITLIAIRLSVHLCKLIFIYAHFNHLQK
jgi:hypothetical protein